MSVEVPLSKGKFAIIDDDDLPSVQEFNWHALETRPGHFYAARQVRLIGEGRRQRHQYMHTFLTGYAKTDHVNGNGLDNQRINLRQITTAQQNNRNRRKTSGHSSQFKGVYRHKIRGLWAARVTVSGKGVHLGYFADERDAAMAYDTEARKLFAEFARLNFPLEGEQGCLPPIA